MDPLDEHHTYFYYQLLQSGIVKEVIIYSNRSKMDAKQNIPNSIAYPCGAIRVSYDPEFTELNNSFRQIIYIRDKGELGYVPDGMKNHFIIYKCLSYGFPKKEWLKWLPRYVPYVCRRRTLNKDDIDLVLAEGPYNQKFVPRNIKSLVWPSLSNRSQYVKRIDKVYDWICISSTQPRKRLYEFLHMVSEYPTTRSIRGCIVVNKTEPGSPSGQEFLKIEQFINQHKLDVSIKTQTCASERMHLLCQSKVFVSTAVEDSGPRTVIEAGQAGNLVLAMKHHGSATVFVRNGINGELTWRFSQFPRLLVKILTNYEKYDSSINKVLLSKELWLPPILSFIKKHSA